MTYSEESGKLLISVSEFVAIAKRGISPISPYGDESSQAVSEEGEVPLIYGVKLGDIEAELYGTPYLIEDGRITVCRTVNTRRKRLLKEARECVRGELFIYGKMYTDIEGREAVTLVALYKDEFTGEVTEERETAASVTLNKFFDKCAALTEKYSVPERDRVKKRLPTMKAAKFPYSDIREGQSEMIRAVYRTIARGGELYATAPTGTGKTVSVLYPAIKALGDKRCDKVFYLTPKTTAQKAAADCLQLLNEGGVSVRAVIITSKDKICPHGRVCKRDARECPVSKNKGLADAVLELYNMSLTVATRDEIRAVAEKYGVCPYELTLDYSEICDVVISDFNYVFDPASFLRRYFEAGGRYSLVIDEAHNLAERAREMYSAEITSDELLLIDGEDSRTFISIIEPFLTEDARKDENGCIHSAAHLSDVPGDMYTFVDNILAKYENTLHRAYVEHADVPERIYEIRELYYKIKKLSTALDEYDEGYRLLLFRDGDTFRAKLFAIDTGKRIRTRLDKLHGAVFFSATLEPASYFTSVLGGDRSSDTLTVASPFDPSILSVSIIDGISTRYSERDKTLLAVSRVIAATLSARRGHYMVFAPSYEYSEALYNAFTAKYPKVAAILERPGMSDKERGETLSRFSDGAGYLVGFCVLGGVFSEGIDLAGDRLIGAVVVGIGMPTLSYEREAIADYYTSKLDSGREYAYIYPGMNKVLQAAGRVIRREDDRGVIVLIDDRFRDPIYKKSIPDLWRGMQYIANAKELKERLDLFWEDVDKER